MRLVPVEEVSSQPCERETEDPHPEPPDAVEPPGDGQEQGATSWRALRRFNQRAASTMTASVTARVNSDGTNEAQPAAPPNATLQITLSSEPALITARPHSQLRLQNAVASATKNATTSYSRTTRTTTLPSSKNCRSHARYPSTRALGFSGAGNQKRLVGKRSRVTTIPQRERL